MPLVVNQQPEWPGAHSVAIPPLDSGDCARYPSLDELVEAQSQAGKGATIKAGRGWFQSTIAQLSSACALPTPNITSSLPNPTAQGAPQETVGTNFGAAQGQAWLTDANTWGASVIKVQQTITLWNNTHANFTTDLGALAGTDLWLYIITALEQRSTGYHLTTIPP